MTETDIAPCGMVCSLCHAYQRSKNTCGGCKSGVNIFDYCNKCIIRNCPNINKTSAYCFYCTDFPCKRLKALDSRYRKKYNMSFIENLNTIKERGVNAFIAATENRWKCESCGGLICIHKKQCLKCGKGV